VFKIGFDSECISECGPVEVSHCHSDNAHRPYIRNFNVVRDELAPLFTAI